MCTCAFVFALTVAKVAKVTSTPFDAWNVGSTLNEIE